VTLVAIDPGVRAYGWALFGDNDRLERCGLARADATTDLYAARLIEAQIPRAHLQVIELPRIYEQRKSKGNPEDVLRVAVMAGHTSARGTSWLVRPHDWKGDIPKRDRSGRAIRIESYIVHRRNVKAIGEYMPQDVPASLAHNVADAVGIGLWWLRRKEG